MPQCLHHLSGLSLDSLSMSMSLLYCGSQKCTQHSRCGLTSTEWRGRISFHLLAILCPMQPRLPFAFFARANFCLTLTWVSTRTPAPFLPSCFPFGQCPACTGAWGCSSLGARLHISPWWTSWCSCWLISLTCWGLSGWHNDRLVYQPLVPVLCHLQTTPNHFAVLHVPGTHFQD